MAIPDRLQPARGDLVVSRAVISLAGSGVVTQGISQSIFTGDFREIITVEVAGWTYQGRELPYLRNIWTEQMDKAVTAGEPIVLG